MALPTFQAIWAPLAQTAVWLTGLTSAFVVAPPLLWVDASSVTNIAPFTQFLLAMLTGFLFLLSRSKRSNPRLWTIAAILGVVIGVVLFFVYQELAIQWTCGYAGRSAVRGATYLPGADAYLTQHPETTCSGLIMAYAGQTNQIWPETELVWRQLIVALCFICLSLTISLSVMSLIEAIRRRKLP